MAADDKKGGAALPPAAPAAPKGPMTIALVNTVAVVALLGTAVYTRILYKRPAITEEGERERLSKVHASPTPPPAPGLISFEPVTVNIASNPSAPKPADGTARQIQGKHHYVTMGFALELRDIEQKDDVDALRPVLMDKMLSMLGRKAFHELTTVQGRYILRTEIMDLANRLIAQTNEQREALVTNVYFTHFIVQ